VIANIILQAQHNIHLSAQIRVENSHNPSQLAFSDLFCIFSVPVVTMLGRTVNFATVMNHSTLEYQMANAGSVPTTTLSFQGPHGLERQNSATIVTAPGALWRNCTCAE
jgi:hypothetical protein